MKVELAALNPIPQLPLARADLWTKASTNRNPKQRVFEGILADFYESIAGKHKL